MPHRRLAGRLLSSLALIAALTGCGEGIPPRTDVRIGVFQVQDFLPYFVMQEEGLDARNGLRFVEHSFSGGAAALQAMAEGSLDVSPGVAIVVVLTAAERGLVPSKVVWVAANDVADRDHPGIALLVSHSVQGWKDLSGQKIAVNARDSVAAAAVDVRLNEEGVVGHSFVNIPFSNMGLAVAGGNVAAAGMAEPYFTQSLLRRDGRLLDWVVGGRPFERTQFTGIVFSAAFHRSNPAIVKGYLRAHLAAVKWINANPEKGRLLLARRLNLSPDVAKSVHLLRWPLDARIDPALLSQAQQVLVRAKLLREPGATAPLYDETLLAEVLKEKL
jgi:NitT/TauT family transport system substrate-binding protein